MQKIEKVAYSYSCLLLLLKPCKGNPVKYISNHSVYKYPTTDTAFGYLYLYLTKGKGQLVSQVLMQLEGLPPEETSQKG